MRFTLGLLACAVSAVQAASVIVRDSTSTVAGRTVVRANIDQDFSALAKSGIKYVYLETFLPILGPDTTLPRRMQAARDAGLKVGAFWGYRSTVGPRSFEDELPDNNAVDTSDAAAAHKSLPFSLFFADHCPSGSSQTQTVQRIKTFYINYNKNWKHYPVLRTTVDWWTKCTGNTKELSDVPLWLVDSACSATFAGTFPGGWTKLTFCNKPAANNKQDIDTIFFGSEVDLEAIDYELPRY